MKINNLTIKSYKVPYCDNRIIYYVYAPDKKLIESFITKEGAISFATETLDFCSKRYIKTLINREIKKLKGWIGDNRQKDSIEVNFSTKYKVKEFIKFCDERGIKSSDYVCGYKRYCVKTELGEY